MMDPGFKKKKKQVIYMWIAESKGTAIWYMYCIIPDQSSTSNMVLILPRNVTFLYTTKC